LERLKILMQVQGNERIYRGVWQVGWVVAFGVAAASCSSSHTATDLRQGLVHMAKTEGIKGMMKGNGTNCARIIPNSAVKFFTYEQLSRCAAECPGLVQHCA
jgi:solute carrier family 25 (mitochondrial phosphate transporter), member 23/24/25/41